MRGTIENGVYFKYEDEKDKLRLYGGSWTINLDEIKDKIFEIIVFKTKEDEYTISYKKAFDIGIKKNFRGENKLVVPVKYWNRKMNPKQDTLF